MSNRRTLIKAKRARRHAYEGMQPTAESVPDLVATNHTPVRWTCYHHIDGSDVTAYVMASGGLETIAQTRQANGIDARANAELIVRAVNNHDRYWPIINDLVSALELCLQCQGITWEAEQEASVVLRKIKNN